MQQTYYSLLEPIGFEIRDIAGIGGPMLSLANHFTSIVRNHFGDILVSPLMLLAIPFVWFDSKQPTCPFSIYVRAIKKKKV